MQYISLSNHLNLIFLEAILSSYVTHLYYFNKIHDYLMKKKQSSISNQI
jgi:hypothetical protein